MKPDITTLLVTLVAALAGGVLFERLHVPAGALIGGMVGVAAVKLLFGTVQQMPGAGRFLAYVAVGWVVGQTLDRQVLSAIRPVLLPLAGSLMALLAVAAVAATVLVRLGILDPATAYLAMSPGALSQMAVLGAETGANVPVLVGVHLARVVAVVLAAPIILRYLPGG